MSRKKTKKQSASERRQEEIQRRMQKAEEKKSKPKPDKKQKAPEQAPQQPAPAEKPERRQGRPRGREIRRAPAMPVKLLSLHDAGDAGADCRLYDVTFPQRMDLGGLLKAIRDGNYMRYGKVYISAGLAQASAASSDMSYELRSGVYVRAAAPNGKSRKAARWLADLVDRPVKAVRASGGWGAMDWFVDLRPDLDESRPVASTPEGMSLSEITEGPGA